MSSVGGEELTQWDIQGLSTGHEEKIFVSVRLRPLNENEIARNDVLDWECINDDTIIFKNSLAERTLYPIAYKFDRVFGYESSTRQVYEEGAKGVALSVISGINSTVFAYGQTSSGKTYTMSGITEYAVSDIYDYIRKHNDREFVLKFSALEIYNECVRDLLSTDNTPLRLLDDPERGTVVEKLTEETLEDWSHLKELLSICDAQRQIGETALNEMSSRSHQILRLTIQSSARELLGAENSSTLTSTVNFVDLAGSERASQASSAGVRLKEGCHINRSLLTLGKVIRTLSKGRNMHIPYRDSKLTRILQNSLGGNARTAIICTMSPARSHVEQSRNTLLFASCAKQVNTNAQVNVVMSEKALVKQLQRELARLESELKRLGSNSAISNTMVLLKEKEVLIEKMDKEIKELTKQRDLAQSQVEDLLRSVGEHHFSGAWAKPDQFLKPSEQNAWVHENSASESSEVVDPHRLDVVTNIYERSDSPKFNKLEIQLPDNSEDCFLPNSISPQLFLNKFFGPDPCKGWENIVQKTDEDSENIAQKTNEDSENIAQKTDEDSENSISQKTDEDSEDQWKEVRCIEMEEPTRNRKIRPDAISSLQKGDRGLIHTQSGSSPTYEALKQKIQDMQKTIDYLASPYCVGQSPSSTETGLSGSRSASMSRSRSCKAVITSVPSPPWFEEAEQMENTPHYSEKDFPDTPEGYQPKVSESKSGSNIETLSRKDYEMYDRSFSMDEKEHNIKISGESDIASILFRAAGLDELVKSKFEKKFDDDLDAEAKTDKSGQIVKNGGSDIVEGPVQPTPNWPLEFEKQRGEIIELWDVCCVPLVHRTYFFMLFKGDPSDSVYMEVELRRLSFLKYTLSNGSNIVNDDKIPTRFTSRRALNREREMLSKQILKKFSSKEREDLYKKWGIGLNTKQRRLQVSRRLWTDTKDMDHIKESAALVAKLVGFVESGHTPKEMFGLSFAARPLKSKSFIWKNSMSSLI